VRVFLTGGTGLVGSHVAAALVSRGDRVLALARSEAAAAELCAAGAEPVRGELADLAVLERAVAESDAVVHAAAVIVRRAEWDLFHTANVAPTEAIAHLAARAGVRLVHVSSVAVYGRRTVYDGGPGTVTEDFGLERPLFSGDHYARSKREAEQALWRVARDNGLRAAALRPCVIYGEGDRTFASRVAGFLARGWAPLIGDGANPLAVVYAGNVAAAVLAALDRPDATGPFNVANDGELSQRDFLERFARGLGVRLRLVSVPWTVAWRGARLADAALRLLRPRRPMSLLKTAVHFLGRPNPFDSGRACRELDWRPVVPPQEAVERTGQWFRSRRP
jgi:nucleoside-diphosphate-sugar epimerase